MRSKPEVSVGFSGAPPALAKNTQTPVLTVPVSEYHMKFTASLITLVLSLALVQEPHGCPSHRVFGKFLQRQISHSAKPVLSVSKK